MYLSLYTCEFPGCGFSTSKRNLIDEHHIIPRSMPGSSNKKRNLIWVCPGCHRKIYVPGCTHGQHSINHDESIVILGRLDSTKGRALWYRKSNESKEHYYFYTDKDTWSL